MCHNDEHILYIALLKQSMTRPMRFMTRSISIHLHAVSEINTTSLLQVVLIHLFQIICPYEPLFLKKGDIWFTIIYYNVTTGIVIDNSFVQSKCKKTNKEKWKALVSIVTMIVKHWTR